MLKRTLTIGILLLVAFGYANAGITYDYAIPSPDDGTITTPVVGATVDTFDTTSPFTWTGDITIKSGSVVGAYAAPSSPDATTQPDPTNFGVVPIPPERSGAATLTFGAGESYDYLGLYWGSMDNFNSIDLYLGTDHVALITGNDVATPPEGSWTEAYNNKYVNILMGEFDKVVFSSNGVAFEFDNVAVGNVIPAPGALLLGSLGAGLIGWMRKRKSL